MTELEKKWRLLADKYSFIDMDAFPNWIPLKEAFLSGTLTLEMMRETRAPGLAYDVWMCYTYDVYPEPAGFTPIHLWDIDQMLEYLTSLG